MWPDGHPRPSVAVDLVVLSVAPGGNLQVLLIRRGEAPFRGELALPGGFLRVGPDGSGGEGIEEAARRELAEETGLVAGALEPIGFFGDPGRDPRTRVLSLAWCALVPPDPVRGGTDAAEALWVPARSPGPLAFDHAAILTAGLARVSERLPALARALVPPTFTVAELRAVFAAVRGEPPDIGNFRRYFARLIEDGAVLPTGHRPSRTRPATLYRFA